MPKRITKSKKTNDSSDDESIRKPKVKTTSTSRKNTKGKEIKSVRKKVPNLREFHGVAVEWINFPPEVVTHIIYMCDIGDIPSICRLNRMAAAICRTSLFCRRYALALGYGLYSTNLTDNEAESYTVFAKAAENRNGCIIASIAQSVVNGETKETQKGFIPFIDYAFTQAAESVNNSVWIMQILLYYGFPVNGRTKTPSKKTQEPVCPLILAIDALDIDLVTFLLDNDANINIHKGKPLQTALENMVNHTSTKETDRHNKLVELLIERGANPEENDILIDEFSDEIAQIRNNIRMKKKGVNKSRARRDGYMRGIIDNYTIVAKPIDKPALTEEELANLNRFARLWHFGTGNEMDQYIITHADAEDLKLTTNDIDWLNDEGDIDEEIGINRLIIVYKATQIDRDKEKQGITRRNNYFMTTIVTGERIHGMAGIGKAYNPSYADILEASKGFAFSLDRSPEKYVNLPYTLNGLPAIELFFDNWST